MELVDNIPAAAAEVHNELSTNDPNAYFVVGETNMSQTANEWNQEPVGADHHHSRTHVDHHDRRRGLRLHGELDPGQLVGGRLPTQLHGHQRRYGLLGSGTAPTALTNVTCRTP
jgi:hypothetical protein